MSFFALARLIAVIATGLLAGIFLGSRMGPSIALRGLPATSFVKFQRTVHTYFVRFMPPLQILAVLGSLAWAYSLRSAMESPPFVLISLAAAGAICVFGVTLAVNVPINKKLMTWDPAAPPANLREIWAPWERVNTLRTILSANVFVLEAIVIATQGAMMTG